MTSMPIKSYLTSGTTTEAQFQSAIGDLYDVLNQLAIIGPQELNTLLSGSISPLKCNIKLDTENAIAADNLNLIVPNNIGEKMIFLKISANSRAVTLKHMASGTGKMYLNTEADVVLNDTRYCIALHWDETAQRWNEVWRNFGVFIAPGSESVIRTQLGLGTAATRDVGLLTGQIPLRENFGTAAFVNTGVSSGQVPLANQLGSLAFKSTVTDAELNGSGVSPGTYDTVTVNAQGRVTAGTSGSSTGAKVWVSWNGANGAIYSSYGVSYVVRIGGGTYRVTFSTPFANTNYAAIGGSDIDGAVFMQSDAGGDAVPATRCYNYTTTTVDVQTTPRGADGGRMSLVIFAA